MKDTKRETMKNNGSGKVLRNIFAMIESSSVKYRDIMDSNCTHRCEPAGAAPESSAIVVVRASSRRQWCRGIAQLGPQSMLLLYDATPFSPGQLRECV